jgi:RND superfamily putative drug exporter
VDKLKDSSHGRLKISAIGAPMIIKDATETAMNDLERMDMVVLPLAFSVLGLTLRSARLLLVPIATMATGAAGAFGIMALVARFINVSSVAPSLMMSILIAMNFDYSLFLLTRLRTELARGLQMPEAVEMVLSTAGVTITVRTLRPAAEAVRHLG